MPSMPIGRRGAISIGRTAWRDIDRIAGRAFNLGGGPDNAVSLRQLLDHISDLIARPVAVRHAEWRAGDQRYFVADTRAVTQALGLGDRIGWRAGVADLAEWLSREGGMARPSVEVAA